jgi:D-threonine aldolase
MEKYSMNWYQIQSIETIDSPSLIVYKERVAENIQNLIELVPDRARLRPHVKTNKSAEVCRMLLDAGITKFKSATIAEAEMLASLGAANVVLAYQPTGPKIIRLLNLIEKFPDTRFACLVDNVKNSQEVSLQAQSRGLIIDVYLDVNVGMNRTGVLPENLLALYLAISGMQNVDVQGIHVYDGHIRETDIIKRKKLVDESFNLILKPVSKIEQLAGHKLKIIAGGSPSFSVHAQRPEVECSPGTFIYWDWKYKTILPELPFQLAALVVTRIISIINQQLICLDLGHKAIASENPFPRVHFLNVSESIEAVSQNEEHMVVRVLDTSVYEVGDVWYGAPMHICPTVAWHQHVYVAEGNKIVDKWQVTARNRFISV